MAQLENIEAIERRLWTAADTLRACVCLANSEGGRLLIGFEDGDGLPPAGQEIAPELPDAMLKRIGELTANVKVFVSVHGISEGCDATRGACGLQCSFLRRLRTKSRNTYAPMFCGSVS